MGSARVSNAKPIPMETTDKKSLKTLIKSLFHKKKERPKIDKKEQIEEKHDSKIEVKPIQNTDTVAAILENFNKLNLEDRKPVKQENTDDELDNFTFKVIDEPRNERIHSQSSEDSGFSDTKEAENTVNKTENENKVENDDKFENENKLANDENTDDLVEDLEKLDLDDKKKKKLRTVVVARGPTRTKLCVYSSTLAPYPTQEQISQINKHTLTGGQVIVNQYTAPDNLSEFNIALESVQKQSQYHQNDREEYLEDVLEYINEDTMKKSLHKSVVSTDFAVQERKITHLDYSEKKSMQTYLDGCEEKTIQHNELMQLLQENYDAVGDSSTAIDDFVQNNLIEREDLTHIYNYVEKELNSISNDGFITSNYTYPTPPRSETVPSPMSASPSSFYPNSEYTLSPERSPIYNSDNEKYQDIPHFEEEKDATDKKSRERTISVSSMTMKQFKDMQKEIVYNFSKKDCCQMSRKSCKELFQEHMQKLNMAERKNLCLDVANLDLKNAYGVLHHIMISLSSSSEKEDLQYALFGLVCDRILAQDAALFVGDAGLSLLKSAALRCPRRPLLTRYLVQCIRTALKADPNLVAGKDHIFHEVDVLGDNLVIACARAGDRCSDVLSELVRSHDSQPPLFRLHHTNADGYTALHVACSQHSAANPRLHTVHVLLVHAGFDITEGDLKGRDTALHLAVNSAHCDLQLILMMFKQVDRKDWKSLAHWPNLSTKTPIDLARLATKTTTRQNYPQEVLDFLKKCR